MKSINLKNTKIYIGNNPELLKKILDIAYIKGFEPHRNISVALNKNPTTLYFHDDMYIGAIHSTPEKKWCSEQGNYIELFEKDFNFETIYEIY